MLLFFATIRKMVAISGHIKVLNFENLENEISVWVKIAKEQQLMRKHLKTVFDS